MTIIEAMRAPALFADAFDGETWNAWRVFLRAVFALPMSADDLAIYQRHTGRTSPPTQPAREVVCLAGRGGGKDRVASLIGVYLAVFRAYRTAPGECPTIALIAADRSQSRILMRYVAALFDVPLLAKLVVRKTAHAIELVTGVVIEVTTNSARTSRGYSFAAVVGDEVCFWRMDDAADADHAVLTAVRPGLAKVPASLLLLISSPYSPRGAMWTAYRRYYGNDDAPVLVWRASTLDMNPAADREAIRAAYEADPVAAAAEYGGEFRTDLEAFVAREVVEAATVPGRVGLPPMEGARYVGFCDPSGGASDAFTLAIAHTEERGGARVAVLDYLAERCPPFSPDAVVAEYAVGLKSYGLATVEADKYAGAWVTEAFSRHGIACRQSAEPKSTLYANALPLLNSGRVELLDRPRLHAQLLGLERRTARGGRDSIDHAPGAHDDLANAAAGALVAAIGPGEPAFLTFLREWVEAPQRGEPEPVADPPVPPPGIPDVVVPDPSAADALERRRRGYELLERRVRGLPGISVG